MVSKNRDLPVPESVESANKAMELARIWIADKNSIIALTPNLWEEPRIWGILLCDMARHIAKSYERKGLSYNDIINKIREGFDVEWENPTDDPQVKQ